MVEVLLSELSWEALVSGLFLKAIIGVLFIALAFIFKPVRIKGMKWLKKVTGRTKYSVVVTGRVYPKQTRMSKSEGFPFEIELPYKDVSEHSMPIQESDSLIYSAINQKYAKDFYSNGYSMNHVKIRKVES